MKRGKWKLSSECILSCGAVYKAVDQARCHNFSVRRWKPQSDYNFQLTIEGCFAWHCSVIVMYKSEPVRVCDIQMKTRGTRTFLTVGLWCYFVCCAVVCELMKLCSYLRRKFQQLSWWGTWKIFGRGIRYPFSNLASKFIPIPELVSLDSIPVFL